ncbi:Drug/metabolite transporter, partial [Globisporangium splendens]
MAAPLGLETPQQRGIFLTYMSLWVSYGLLNELAKRHDVHFNSTSAVVLQSFLKLGIATYMYLTTDAVTAGGGAGLVARVQLLLQQIVAHRELLWKYFIPSGLYVLYDVLSYVNLRRFDASTYFLLLQFRMVITGMLHQFMFQKQLNRNQWISLAVTTLGCAIKTLGSSSSSKGQHETHATMFAYGLLIIQMLSSTFAGVYNEVLLKKQAKISFNLQNIFMYMDSIICTIAMLVLGLTGQSFAQVITPSEIAVLFSWYVLPMVLIMSFIGVVTSLFLKVLDSVRKAIASALELVFLPLLSTILFGAPLTLSMVVSVVFVASGVYIYSLPVESKSSKSSSAETHKVAVDDLEKGDEGSKA